MKILLNVIWLALCGLWMAIGYLVAALICFVLFFLVITIPFGIASFRMAVYALWPFGRTIVWKPTAGVGAMLGNVLWIVLCGWWLALGHLLFGLLMCVTIIGIPLGIASFKMIPISLTPLGRDIVPTDDPRYLYA
ncbi:YccF domain-containing protein [Yinghuangia sp. ASG 101]|uniref:YccF domain-containing protein n=1 Tax=Yinghuangia sp. ASG 101 TaxID=2896848 RepID=UPI001E4D2F70|nr:YccF domain-containing protein [Yinghuangia sp. ASG 101]UGQ14666.1 YccF domain-containing protein [Yinghuangia sp. ASG 101]